MPDHPVHQMTTSELAAYKADLLAAMNGLSRESPALAQLQVRLEMVMAEERSRESIAGSTGRAWPIGN
jgi:hypothetical protein